MTLFPRNTNKQANQMPQTKAEAHRILDMAKAGLDVSPQWVTWALVVTGDLTGKGGKA